MFAYLTNRESRSIGILFMINAFAFSNWAVRIPDVKTFLNIGDAQLGLALLAAPIGIILFTPVTSYSINKFGTGKVAIVCSVMTLFAFIGLGIPQTFQQLVLAIFIFGTFGGAMDISMNGVASAIEKKQDRIIMSTTHGFWSLGAMIASFIAGYIASYQISYLHNFIGVAIFCTLLLFFVTPVLWGLKDKSESSLKLIWPGSNLAILTLLAFMIFMVEGGIADWSALFYQEILESPKKYIGFGFGGFSAAMAFARFAGDRVMSTYNAKRILLTALLMACICLFIFAQGYSILISTFFIILTGLACAVIVPLIFREAGSSTIVPPSVGLAMVSSVGYAGFLVGPPVIGFVSEEYGLNYSFVFLSLILLTAAALSRRLA